MTQNVITVSPGATVSEAAGLMIDHNVSCLPVVDGRNHVVGILTHGDFGLHHRFHVFGIETYSLLGSWVEVAPEI